MAVLDELVDETTGATTPGTSADVELAVVAAARAEEEETAEVEAIAGAEVEVEEGMNTSGALFKGTRPA